MAFEVGEWGGVGLGYHQIPNIKSFMIVLGVLVNHYKIMVPKTDGQG